MSVWTALVAATLVGWLLRLETAAQAAGLIAAALAVVKVRLIGHGFMGLGAAARPLRTAFDVYLMVLLVTLVVGYLWG
jgi:hypothetical protein